MKKIVLVLVSLVWLTGSAWAVQHDYDIADQAGASFLTDLNNVIDAIVTTNSGATEPTSKFTYMLWGDTTSGKAKMWDGAAWQVLWDLSTGAPDIKNDQITEAMLKAVDAAVDEECLTFESTTGDFEWQTCGAGGTHPVADTTSIVQGSVDTTKQVRLEADGLTASTTRVLTVQDKDITIADDADLTAHTGSSANPHSVTKAQVGLANVPDLKQNLTATTDPGATDDTNAGYSVGSRWINVTLDKEFVAVDVTASNAVWKDTSAGAAGGDPDQNIWTTITPDSGTSPVPDTTTDALTIAGGTGITTTGDSGADSITVAMDQTANITPTGKYDFGGGTLEIPNGTTLPGTCSVGDQFMDTDAPTGQRHYLCESANTWALQGDGTGGGSGSMTTVKESGTQLGGADIVTLDFGAGFDLTETPDTEVNVTLDLTEKQVNLVTEVTGSLPDANVANDLTIAGGNIATTDIVLEEQGVGDPTVDGDIEWDTNTETLKVGDDGAATKEFFPGAHTTDTQADEVCAGTTTYLDGEGNCDDISTVYEGTLSNEAGLYAALSDITLFLEDLLDDTTPQLGGNLDTNAFNVDFDTGKGIRDDSGNEQLTFTKTASAVNEFEITNAATGNGPQLAVTGGDTNIDLVLKGKGTGVVKGHNESFCVAISDETTAITTGTAKLTMRMPYAFTVNEVRASINTVSSSGLPTFDINDGGTTILSTKLTIDASEKTSETAATAAVISDSALADDAEITFDIDVAGTGAKGAKICMIGDQ